MSQGFDVFTVIGVFLAFIPIYVYLTVFRDHYLVSRNRHAQILQLRVAGIMPAYPLFMALCLPFPNLFPLAEAIISFLEGYCIFCYWGLLVSHVGGVDAALNIIKDKSRWPCSCLTPKQYFDLITRLMLLLVYVKPLIDLLITIVEYSVS